MVDYIFDDAFRGVVANRLAKPLMNQNDLLAVSVLSATSWDIKRVFADPIYELSYFLPVRRSKLPQNLDVKLRGLLVAGGDEGLESFFRLRKLLVEEASNCSFEV